MKKEMSLDKKEEAFRIAAQIMSKGKRELSVDLPVFQPAIFGLNCVPKTEEEGIDTMATNGYNLYYNPVFTIKMYKENPLYIKTIIFHEILHCMFNHITRIGKREHTLWNIATDVAINYTIKDLNESLKKNSNGRDFFVLPKGSAEDMVDKENQMTNTSAEKIYLKLVSEIQNQINGKKSIFDGEGSQSTSSKQNSNNAIDASKLGLPQESIDKLQKKIKSLEESTKMGDHSMWNGNQEDSKKDGESPKSGEGSPKFGKDTDASKKLEEKWKNISSQVKARRNMKIGELPGSMSTKIDELTDSKIRWDEMLRKFATTLKELEKPGDSYCLRTLGALDMYEESEESEEKVINDLVIAIDTSGSINHDVFKKFMSETAAILSSVRQENMSINFYIIQCDTKITDVKHIRKLKSVNEIKDIEIKGGGGTNFVPVFELVNKLVSTKKLKKLKGMLFFTDGFGTFPKTPPLYKTLWVFADKYHIDKSQVPFGSFCTITEDNI